MTGETAAPGEQERNPHERQEDIRERILAQGFVRVSELASAHAVSNMTIRRDLDALEEQGWVRKVRGGATAEPSAFYHGDVRHRMQAMNVEKRAIAARAVELVERGQTVMLDESTTGYGLAQLLPSRRPVTVITNFLPSLHLLSRQPGVDLIALGGSYKPSYDAFLGPGTAESVGAMTADLLFASTTAITDGACYHRSQETILVKQALMRAAARKVLLVDHAKFGRRAVHHLAPVDAFDVVVVDTGIDEAHLADLRARDIEVILVDVDEG